MFECGGILMCTRRSILLVLVSREGIQTVVRRRIGFYLHGYAFQSHVKVSHTPRQAIESFGLSVARKLKS